VLIIRELIIDAFLLTILFYFYPCYYLALSFYSCTCWVPTISVLNLVIFSCYSNLLLKRRRWIKILWRGVLGYVLPWLSFLWSYGVFRCSVSLRVIIVFRDIIYVIIILYSWHLVICEYFWPYVWNNWSWIMHTMSTWFWQKNRVRHEIYRARKQKIQPPQAQIQRPITTPARSNLQHNRKKHKLKKKKSLLLVGEGRNKLTCLPTSGSGASQARRLPRTDTVQSEHIVGAPMCSICTKIDYGVEWVAGGDVG
jgi:hypothetical protein